MSTYNSVAFSRVATIMNIPFEYCSHQHFITYLLKYLFLIRDIEALSKTLSD